MKRVKQLRIYTAFALVLFLFASCRFFQESSEYYGMDIKTKKNVFVIDISGSMEGKVEKDLEGNVVATATEEAAKEIGNQIGGRLGGMVTSKARKEMTKLAEVKNQLIPVIKGLPEGSYFNIITFENEVEKWKDNLVLANSTNISMAVLMIENLESGGGTNLFGGIEKAFDLAGAGARDTTLPLNVETIFFLTDGEPSAGNITNPTKILEKTKEMNSGGRVIINSIGLGKDKDADFLRKLANQNGGTYIDK